jgi:hypothetical protein
MTPPRRLSFHQTLRLLIALAATLALMVAWNLFVPMTGAYASKASVRNAASVGGCPLFPADNIWNQDISSLPVSSKSATYIASIGASGHLHPDFGAGLYDGGPIGIPYTVVPQSQAKVPVSFNYADESDPGPYPIPPNAPVEGGAQSSGDRHVLVVQSGTCKLYEVYAGYKQSNGSWKAGSGAVWQLTSNALRPSGWTSADAAGLPILPGLVRYDEVASGVISHALRFTVSQTRNAFIWPARHQASSNSSASLPPMGLRLRLKASVNISSFSRQDQVILTALKRYGMMVADNGSSWFISGAPDDRWNNDDLAQLKRIPGSDFEVVDTSGLQVSANSGQARGGPQAGKPTPTPTRAPSPTPTQVANTPTSATRAQATQQRTNASTGFPAGPIFLAAGGIAMLGLVGLGIVMWRQRRLPYEDEGRD